LLIDIPTGSLENVADQEQQKPISIEVSGAIRKACVVLYSNLKAAAVSRQRLHASVWKGTLFTLFSAAYEG